MLLTELLLHLTRIFFVGLAITTALDFLIHRDKIRREIALVFICLSSGILVSLFRSIIGLEPTELPWLSKISQFAIMTQPYLLLRLVRYFRFVPPTIIRASLIGLVLSWAVLLLSPTPLPPLLLLFVVLYFAVVDGYVVFAFIQGALETGGVTRQRLRFAAIGSALLALVLLLSGIRTVLPDVIPDISSFVQLLSILSALAYYIGFAPPRWLRYGWKFAELRNYLLPETSELYGQLPPEILDRLRLAVIGTINTNKVSILLWDEKAHKLIAQTPNEIEQLTSVVLNGSTSTGIISQAWKDKQAVVVYQSPSLSSEDQRLMQTMDAEALYIVPIITSEHSLGLILAFLEYGSLFVEDDLKLLTIFAQQTGIVIENIMILEQQRRYSEELEHKVQQRTAALQRSNEELQQFAHIVSHDLKEPLRMVTSYVQLIESLYNDKLDDDGREFIHFAVDGAARMNGLIEDMLSYARVRPQSQDYPLIDLRAVMNDVCKVLRFTIEETGATIEVDPLPTIKGDERLLSQLLQNLVSNSLKYQKDQKPHIQIKAKQQQNEWLFSVQDNGIGIEAEDLNKIFVIFERGQNRNGYDGSGIGLAICKKVVEYHDGRIWAESEVGKGTTFYFSIPHQP